MNTNHRTALVTHPRTGRTVCEVYELPDDVLVHTTRPTVRREDARGAAWMWIAEQCNTPVAAA